MEKIYLRPATSEDLMLLYKWVNDSAVRKNSLNTKNISIAEHKNWFEKSLADDDVKIFILMKEEEPIGQVRLNKTGNVHTISYSIDVNYRAQGYGKIILQLLENKLAEKNFVGVLVGSVKKNNVASQLIFKSLGYEEIEENSLYRYSKNKVQHYTIDHLTHGGGYCS